MTNRTEFTRSTRKAAQERSAGACESHLIPRHMYGLPEACGNPGAEYDHITPCAAGGDNSLDNCAYLCRPCHQLKSIVDNSMAKKAARRRGDTGQQKRRKQNGPRLKSAGFRNPPKGYVSPLSKKHPGYRKGKLG